MPRSITPGLALAASLVLAVSTLAACGAATTSPSAAAEPSVSAGASIDASPAASASVTFSAAASSSASTGALPVPAACTAPATVTTAQTEGPYYRAGSPERTDLTEAGMAGTHLTLVLRVVTTDCTPVEGAVIDLWQADASGTYDNSGYTLRGHTTTDENGRVVVATVVPGEYPGRTEHIHVKVTPPGGSTLTTQLYFPGVNANDADGIYSADLLLDITTSGDGLVGTFTFVVPSA